MAPRRRLDTELVRRGLSATRTEAEALISEGRVLVGGAPADKPARQVAASEAVVVTGPARRFVSRGGDKLEAALLAFSVPVADAVALDAGSSTGGFADCLLQHGVRGVLCVDVGHGQLHPRLRHDPRVCALEGINVRSLNRRRLEALVAAHCPAMATWPAVPVDLVTADLSFISLRIAVPALLDCLRDDGELVILVKPQFEAGRKVAAKGRGVVRDPAVWAETLRQVGGALEEGGAGIMGAVPSPLAGPAGNREFLVHARLGAPPRGPAGLGRLAQQAVDHLRAPEEV